ncbi:MAG: hypothetical protein M3P42_06925 [Actinomycetota bacterium]|nr:hypothetical protein [Actinomycetota bacterium]
MCAVALIVLAILVLAGCQFGSDSGKAEFIRQADAICARYERQISQVPQPRTFLRDFAVYMRRVVPIAREQNGELRQLEAPEDEAADFERMLTLLDEQLGIWESAGEAAFAGDDQQAQATFSRSSGPGEEAQRIAGEIGFFSCARPEG